MSYSGIVFSLGCIWYILEFFLQSLLVRNPQKKIVEKRFLLIISWLLDICGIVFGFLYDASGIKVIGSFLPIVSWIGLSLILIGAVIRWVSIFTLKKYFTVNLNVSLGQKIIDYGIYKRIRHPSYSGLLLSHIGLGLIFCNVVSLILITVPILIWILQRIRIEENMMIDSFKNEYADYILKTKKLIPFTY